MKIHTFIAFFIGLTLALFCCKAPTKLKYSVLKIDSTIKPAKISINNLVKNYKLYHGKYIETSGRFYESFENFSIMKDKDSSTERLKRFWLELDKNLKFGKRSLENMNGNRIIIKGMIDTTDKGHLSQYLATICKIYYWEQDSIQ